MKATRVRGLVLLFSFAALASGQQRPATAIEPEQVQRRVSFGFRTGALMTNLISSRSVTESTTAVDPATDTTTYSNSAARRYTFGPTIEFRATDRFSLTADFLYKRTGYNSGVVVQTQEINDDTDLPDTLSAHYENTRADFWEIPILARYYSKQSEDSLARVYVTGGLNFRTVSGIKTFREAVNADGLSDTDTTPANVQRKNTQGGVVGLGLQLGKETSLKVEFELRYTRWLKKNLELGPTSSGLNQAEAFVAFSF